MAGPHSDTQPSRLPDPAHELAFHWQQPSLAQPSCQASHAQHASPSGLLPSLEEDDLYGSPSEASELRRDLAEAIDAQLAAEEEYLQQLQLQMVQHQRLCAGISHHATGAVEVVRHVGPGGAGSCVRAPAGGEVPGLRPTRAVAAQQVMSAGPTGEAGLHDGSHGSADGLLACSARSVLSGCGPDWGDQSSTCSVASCRASWEDDTDSSCPQRALAAWGPMAHSCNPNPTSSLRLSSSAGLC